jgi:hypothetical protein
MASQLVIPPGYAQFSFFLNNATVGHRCVWTIGGKLAGSGLSPAQGAALQLAVATALKPLWDSQVMQTGFHALIGNDGPPMALDVSDNTVGTATTLQMLPPNVTYLLKKSTAFAGRAFRGRIYLPFVDNGAVSEAGVVSGARMTALIAAAAALFTAPGTGSSTGVTGWWLLHRAEPGVTPPAPTQITNISTTSMVATQRRRLER